jgi:hypothetical protein
VLKNTDLRVLHAFLPNPEANPKPKKQKPNPEANPKPKKQKPNPEANPKPKKQKPDPEANPKPKKQQFFFKKRFQLAKGQRELCSQRLFSPEKKHGGFATAKQQHLVLF